MILKNLKRLISFNCLIRSRFRDGRTDDKRLFRPEEGDWVVSSVDVGDDSHDPKVVELFLNFHKMNSTRQVPPGGLKNKLILKIEIILSK